MQMQTSPFAAPAPRRCCGLHHQAARQERREQQRGRAQARWCRWCRFHQWRPCRRARASGLRPQGPASGCWLRMRAPERSRWCSRQPASRRLPARAPAGKSLQRWRDCSDTRRVNKRCRALVGFTCRQACGGVALHSNHILRCLCCLVQHGAWTVQGPCSEIVLITTRKASPKSGSGQPSCGGQVWPQQRLPT